jgi:hypothetical protein
MVCPSPQIFIFPEPIVSTFHLLTTTRTREPRRAPPGRKRHHPPRTLLYELESGLFLLQQRRGSLCVPHRVDLLKRLELHGKTPKATSTDIKTIAENRNWAPHLEELFIRWPGKVPFDDLAAENREWVEAIDLL